MDYYTEDEARNKCGKAENYCNERAHLLLISLRLFLSSFVTLRSDLFLKGRIEINIHIKCI